MFDFYCGPYPVWLCVGAPVIPGFLWSSLQVHSRRDILNSSSVVLKQNWTVLSFFSCFSAFSIFKYILRLFLLADWEIWNIQKMFVCCTNSIGSQNVGDSPTWGTACVEFVHRKCFDKNSSDWETWFYIKANFFFFFYSFSPSHSVKTV